jgi:hypothetical protein
LFSRISAILGSFVASQKARTRGFASLTLVKFALIGCNWISCAD